MRRAKTGGDAFNAMRSALAGGQDGRRAGLQRDNFCWTVVALGPPRFQRARNTHEHARGPDGSAEHVDRRSRRALLPDACLRALLPSAWRSAIRKGKLLEQFVDDALNGAHIFGPRRHNRARHVRLGLICLPTNCASRGQNYTCESSSTRNIHRFLHATRSSAGKITDSILYEA